MAETAHDLTGIALAQASLAELIGPTGPVILALLLVFFAFTSIAANYSYAEVNLLYLNKSKWVLYLFRIAIVFMVFLGSVSQVSLVWSLADTTMGLMASINLIALLLLTGKALKALKDYKRKAKKGVSLEFNSKKFEAWK